ncbi:MAG TPA: double zinc ribbon domain-containing protein, partial [Miltoncostaeaceae bacterium]|nr:double zinc ribbon domain-containing protein [Miltoncostaeaceae bacterium]
MLAALADLVVPRACAACGLPGQRCCSACLAALPALGPARCARCGHPWPRPVGRCGECRGPLVRADQACA